MKNRFKNIFVICLLLVAVMAATACSAEDLIKPDINLEDKNVTTNDAIEISEDDFDSYYKDKVSEGINKKFLSGINEIGEKAKQTFEDIKEWLGDF